MPLLPMIPLAQGTRAPCLRYTLWSWEQSRKEVPSASPGFPGPCPASAHPEDALRLGPEGKPLQKSPFLAEDSSPPTSAPRSL